MEHSLHGGRAASVLSLAVTITLLQVSARGSPAAAAGDVGAILHTTDGGQTWAWQLGAAGAAAGLPALMGVSFVDAQIGSAVGNGGTVLRTTDGGQLWTEQDSGTSQPLNAIALLDTKIGIAVGDAGTILRTTDGGESWVSQKSGTDAKLTALYFQDSKNGMVVGDLGTVLRTADGGETWEPRRITTVALWGISLGDAEVGFAVGGRDVYRTDDGGDSWQRVSFIPCQTLGRFSYVCSEITAIFFADPDSGWLAGREVYMIRDSISAGKFIARTEDGGVSWRYQYRQGSGFLDGQLANSVYALSFVGPSVGFAAGRHFQYGEPRQGTVLRTTDGGASWMRQDIEGTARVNALSFVDDQMGWIVGSQ